MDPGRKRANDIYAALSSDQGREPGTIVIHGDNTRSRVNMAGELEPLPPQSPRAASPAPELRYEREPGTTVIHGDNTKSYVGLSGELTPEREATNVSDSDEDFERSLLESAPTRDVPDVRLRSPMALRSPTSELSAVPELRGAPMNPVARSAPELSDPMRIANFIEAEDLPQTAKQEIQGPEKGNYAESKESPVPGAGAGADAGHSGGRSPHRKAQIALGVAQMLGGILELGGAVSGRTGLQLAGAGIGQVGGAMAQAQGARVADEAQSKLRQNALDVTAGNHLDSLKEQARGEERQLGRDAIGDQRYADEQALEAERYGDTQARQAELDAAALARDAATAQYRTDELGVRMEQARLKSERGHGGGGGGVPRPVVAPDGSVTVAGTTFSAADLEQMARAQAGIGDTGQVDESRLNLARLGVQSRISLAQQAARKNPNAASAIIADLITRTGAIQTASGASNLAGRTQIAVRQATPLAAHRWVPAPGAVIPPNVAAAAQSGYFEGRALSQNLRAAADLARGMTEQQRVNASTSNYSDENGPEAQYHALITTIHQQFRAFSNWGTPQKAELELLEQYFPEAGINWQGLTGSGAANMGAYANNVRASAQRKLREAGYMRIPKAVAPVVPAGAQ